MNPPLIYVADNRNTDNIRYLNTLTFLANITTYFQTFPPVKKPPTPSLFFIDLQGKQRKTTTSSTHIRSEAEPALLGFVPNCSRVFLPASPLPHLCYPSSGPLTVT